MNKEDMGIIGSFSSFLALMLIATVLAFRHVLDYVLDEISRGTPPKTVEVLFYVMIAAIGVVFVVLPSIPLVTSTIRALREKNLKLAWSLVFIGCVYVFAVVSQFIYHLLVKVMNI